MDKVQDITATTFGISVTQKFLLSRYAVFNIRLYIFVCVAVSLFLIALKKLRSTKHPRGPTRSHAQHHMH